MHDTLVTYRRHRPQYQLLAEYLRAYLRQLTSSLEIYPIIMGRAKSVESLAEKLVQKKYNFPLLEVTDFCGVRVIVHTLKEVQALAEAIRAERQVFSIDYDNSENTAERLAVSSFGYVSDHYILIIDSLPPIEGFDNDKLGELEDLRKWLVEQQGRLRVELQLRTIVQHAWADIYHELGYKNEFELPHRWQREFARLAALLEECDQGFREIADAMGSYDSSYGAFMETEKLNRLAETLETILKVADPSEKGFTITLHRLIKTYLALGNNDGIRTLLEDKVHGPRLQSYAPALRDIGVAFTQANKPETEGFKRGLELLERAKQHNPTDVDTLCSLAGALRRCDGKALELYREAHRRDPANPYALGNYIAEELLTRGDIEVLQYFYPQIEQAIARCKKQIEVKINLPWAYFDLGIFHLYLQQPYPSLHFYARGIESARQHWMVRTAFRTIESLRKKAISLPYIDLVSRLLNLGWWAKCSHPKPSARGIFGDSPAPYERLSYAKLTSPVLLLAGGCDLLEPQHAARLPGLEAVLADFRGIIVSGGTCSGIPQAAGDLQAKAQAGRLTTMGYLPKCKSALQDKRYTHLRFTDGTDFSPLEPLTFYEDWIVSDRNPTELKLLGFNGGDVAATEYRTALALGVSVGIMKDSGRQADFLLQDQTWQGLPNLHVLESAEDVRRFLGLV